MEDSDIQKLIYESKSSFEKAYVSDLSSASTTLLHSIAASNIVIAEMLIRSDNGENK